MSGGNNGQAESSYFFNNGGTQTQTPNIFSGASPSSVVNTVCYSGDGTHYAVGGNDKVLWIFEDATNTVDQEYTLLNNIQDCDFSLDGEYLMAGTDLIGGQSFVYLYHRTCHFCKPGNYSFGTHT